MKLTFSTNGWSEFTKTEFLDIAKDLGFYGVEFHQGSRDVFRGETGEEDLRAADRLKRELNQTGLAVPCYDIVLDAADHGRIRENTEQLLHAVRLCEGAGIPYVRITAMDQIHGDPEAAERTVRDCLAPAIEYAEKGPVCILMETTGIYKDTGRLRLLLNEFASDSLAALWDVHHPYRFGGEDPETTVQNLGAYIRHVHMKDSLPGPGGPVYALVGEGDIPLDSMMNALRSINFDGCLSLEWLPGWMPELADPAIVFPHYVHYMSRY
ncbi:MAG TPA: sugar phosphate isomerase/epimerase family protein, partial [Anaerovoracaceae bacterium]|nr:sugar phosphate isomerase/epimerase family protein [Anaerovoracaceae bacterium]